MENVLRKFDGRAEDYVIGRPTYAEAFVRSLFLNGMISDTSAVADIGCGTGKFAGQLLKYGCTVYGVEPNEDMRKQAVLQLSEYDRFQIWEGTEADTCLKDHCVDAVTVAQAFHWFDVRAFKQECRRILKPGGKVYLIWNIRDMKAKVNQDAYDIYYKFCPGFKGFGGGIKKDDMRIQEFFEGQYEYVEFVHPLVYTEKTFLSRSLSGSYSLKKGDFLYPEYLEALIKLYRRYERDGKVEMRNQTVVYSGTI